MKFELACFVKMCVDGTLVSFCLVLFVLWQCGGLAGLCNRVITFVARTVGMTGLVICTIMNYARQLQCNCSVHLCLCETDK